MSCYEHPDSKIRFEGTYIPRWEEANALVVKAAMAFHQIQYIGWDVVITEQDVVILEMNSHPCLYLQQMTARGLADTIIQA